VREGTRVGVEELEYARRGGGRRYSRLAVASLVSAAVSVSPCGVGWMAVMAGGPLPGWLGVFAWVLPVGALGGLGCGFAGVLACARDRGLRGEWMAVVGVTVGGLMAAVGGVIVVASVAGGRW
jgi:hypothetical protein